MLVYQAWHIGEKNHASLRRPLAVAETHYFFRELMINIIFSCYFFLIYFSKVKTALFFKLVVEEYIYL